jgi:hypothetical protein
MFSLDATFKSVGYVNNVYAFRKEAVLVVRIIGGGDGLKKKRQNFQNNFCKTSI